MAVTWFALATATLVALAFLAYRFRVLDAPGSALAAWFGVVILAAAGAGFLALLILFTGLGVAVTRLGYERKRRRAAAEADEGRRGWRNVLANGATATLVAAAGLFLPDERIAVPFVVAVAVAAADTFGSEIGALGTRAVLVTRPREEVPPGTNGGVSWGGTAAGALGAFLVAVAGHLLVGLPLALVGLVVFAGVLGSLIDSVLGATWESSPGHHDGPLTKADVNLIAVSVPTVALFVPAAFGLL